MEQLAEVCVGDEKKASMDTAASKVAKRAFRLPNKT
jgi:hypothetical protein